MTTLLAVTGLSPAIVTETLYALSRETPTILPERVVFLTTATGAAHIEQQLFTPLPEWGHRTVWETLRLALHASPHQLIAAPPHLICYPDAGSGRAAPLDDITNPADNHAAAEAIFAAVWDIVRDPSHHLIASIAGGRKTMGALLHSAVSLIGRETDRITHILVDPPFDALPGFFFPTQPEIPLLDRQGRAFEPHTARLHLADLPFVALRNRFKELDDLPGSFLALRDSLNLRLRKEIDQPTPLHICHYTSTLTVDGTPYAVRARALAILHFILERNIARSLPMDHIHAAELFHTWFLEKRQLLAHIDTTSFDDSDFRRELNHLRTLLRKAPWSPAKRTLHQPPFTLTIQDRLPPST